ncbi:MAG: N-acetylneuraminate synthase [Rhodocyclaceae bacterium]|nr:N-acetylneuraminate synthase [Rhodocyclaceae bacterium]
MSVLIIAEAGVNHNGDMQIAKQLIDVAAAAGADLVKFQTFRADTLVTKSATKADYQKATTTADESQHTMLLRLELTESMHDELIAHCRLRNIEFFSTAFDLESLEYLNSLGLPRVKVPSGEITNLPYLRKIGSFGKEVILSTGMSNMGEIEAAIDVLEKAGTLRDQIIVLHCNTEYPVPMHEVNLRAMRSIGEAFGVRIGFSDHTEGIEIAIAAVALGATVIEKHFTLDRSLPGPDHKASLEPGELNAMISAIRNVELAFGDGIKRPTFSESRNTAVARKSLVASVAVKQGEVFSAENLAVKRPGNGISPMRWDEVVGRAAPRNFAADELIEL